MTIHCAMFPHMDDLQPDPTSGIAQVVKNYFQYLPNYGVSFAPAGSAEADLSAIHAGSVNILPGIPIVAHNHGLYWNADQDMGFWTYSVNKTVIDVARHASVITVPSEWVAQVFRRDMHLNPVVVPHGVEWEKWQGGEDLEYVLWNKNRSSDACDPTPVNELAMRSPQVRFLTTYAAPNPRPNIRITGTVAFAEMRDMIMKCSVYFASTKETFGISTLEAMSAGKPILGFDHGGTSDLVKHGYNGYLARPGDYDDLAQGLAYCLKHRKTLGYHSRNLAQDYTWEKTAEQVAKQYAHTMMLQTDKYSVAVVIPMYNKAGTVLRAIRSAIKQTHKPNVIYVVNNNSSDDFSEAIATGKSEALNEGISFHFTNCPDQGVAHARNWGIQMSGETLICCLDADDEILPKFIEECRWELANDISLGIAYTGMEVINHEGGKTIAAWPTAYNFDLTPKGKNQVPTCNLFRRDAWERAGGFRQRYAPKGAGSEDADLWLRIGLLGWGGIRATPEPLFRYYLGGAVSGNSEYREKDWRGDKGWLASEEWPFAATITPSNGQSHLVRQYDEPMVSVVIPVGPGHVWTLIDAIDSVEGQTFRKWELIVVDDGAAESSVDYKEATEWNRLKKAFPFVRFLQTPKRPQGAGYARNYGASVAKAPLLLFLDADDWLTPTALADMIEARDTNPDAIIYSDYIGHAYIDNKVFLTKLRNAQRLIDHDPISKETVIRYFAFDYNCELAQAQPTEGQDPYIWNIISSLVPTRYHREIGGFDTAMESWEDWDYWVRMARAGYCFQRIPKPLMEYRFYTGKRRFNANPGESGESGRQLSSHLLEYMREKYQRTELMPCKSCGGGRRSTAPMLMPSNLSISGGDMGKASAGDMVIVELVDGNVGDHLIAFQGTSYGYKSSGDRFQMLRAHAAIDRRVRIITGNQAAAAGAASLQPSPMPPPPPPPLPPSSLGVNETDPEPPTRPTVPIDPLKELKVGGDDKPADVVVSSDSAFDLASLWGVNEDRAILLRSKGVRTPGGIVLMGTDAIVKMFKTSRMIAQRIVDEAQKVVESEEAKKTKA